MIESKILIVDDNAAVLKTLRRILTPEFHSVVTAHDPTVLPALLREGNVDVVLLDMNFSRGSQSGSEGLFWLNQILSFVRPPAVVVMTAYEDVGLAVSSFRKGAVDFIIKPWENLRMKRTGLLLFRSREKPFLRSGLVDPRDPGIWKETQRKSLAGCEFIFNRQKFAGKGNVLMFVSVITLIR